MKKSIIPAVLVIVMVLFSLPVYAEEDTEPGAYKLPKSTGEEVREGDFVAEILEDNTVLITGIDSYEDECPGIPAEIAGYPVTGIGKDAFAFKEFDELLIPDTVKVIGKNAFDYATVNDTFSLPRGVQIEDEAFESATLPDEITIPEGTYVGENAFAYCEGVKTLNLESSVFLDKEAFYYGDDIANVFLSAGNTIGESAFYSCENLSTIARYEAAGQSENTTEGKTVLGKYSFSNCTDLNTVELPDFVSEIKKYAFEYSEISDSLILPENIVIGEEAFYSMRYKGELVIPAGAELDDEAFYSISGVESVIIENDVEIGDECFSYAQDITSVTIGENVTVGKSAFASCNNLTNLVVGDDSELEDNAFAYCSSLQDYEVPDTVVLGDGVFYSTGTGSDQTDAADTEADSEESDALTQANLNKDGDYYRITYYKDSELEMDEEAIHESGVLYYMVLNADGTGVIISDDDYINLTWTDEDITTEDGFILPYTKNGDVIRIEEDEYVMEVTLGKDYPASPDPTPAPYDSSSRAGYYILARINDSEEILDSVDLRNSNIVLDLVLYEDHTGYLSNQGNTIELQWDDGAFAILDDRDITMDYTYDSGVIAIDYDDTVTTFVYAGTPDEAPEVERSAETP